MWAVAFVLPELLLLTVSPAHAALQHARALFDGETLAGWEVVDFLGTGTVEVRDESIVLGAGDPMTGINWLGDFPTVDYELTLEAKKISGNDFFAAITFPVGDDPCTLVIGGWGGGVVGLSSIDGDDALRNVTTRWMRFDYDRWYSVRLRVTGEKIQAWIDDEPVVDFAYPGHELSVRVEVVPNIPFGISTWHTTGALRNIRVRELETAP
ncbi:MAG TPA: DUF1080 domain-containing protein [Longimicrobiales bacterium]|nr:DUF1080 domain-containing protein [Longimicrobiales bacterium]